MPTASLHGKDGTITGITGVSEITEFSAALTEEADEATSQASAGVREFINGLTGGTGSFTARGLTFPPQGDVTLVLNVGGSGSTQISGSAIITTRSISVPHDGVVEFSGDFTFDGVITVGTVT